ncbi:hypothetical protein [Allomuricauda sp. d1]|uniref:hypothetical protein n=1 Tax=Allomuricauda sp. d1 TaxID=3136725 RepID=UPI0031E2EEF8
MKKKLLPFLFVILGVTTMTAQVTAKSVMIQKKQAQDSLDVIDRFDSSLAISGLDLKKSHEQSKKKRERLLRLISSSDLKQRQKEKLSHDVMHNPFSLRLKKFVMSLKEKQQAQTEKAVVINDD